MGLNHRPAAVEVSLCINAHVGVWSVQSGLAPVCWQPYLLVYSLHQYVWLIFTVPEPVLVRLAVISTSVEPASVCLAVMFSSVLLVSQ